MEVLKPVETSEVASIIVVRRGGEGGEGGEEREGHVGGGGRSGVGSWGGLRI